MSVIQLLEFIVIQDFLLNQFLSTFVASLAETQNHITTNKTQHMTITNLGHWHIPMFMMETVNSHHTKHPTCNSHCKNNILLPTRIQQHNNWFLSCHVHFNPNILQYIYTYHKIDLQGNRELCQIVNPDSCIYSIWGSVWSKYCMMI